MFKLKYPIANELKVIILTCMDLRGFIDIYVYKRWNPSVRVVII